MQLNVKLLFTWISDLMRFTEHLFLVSVQHPVISEKTLSTEALVIGTLKRKEANAVMFGVCVCA